jgi:hypothetical protein
MIRDRTSGSSCVGDLQSTTQDEERRHLDSQLSAPLRELQK